MVQEFSDKIKSGYRTHLRSVTFCTASFMQFSTAHTVTD